MTAREGKGSGYAKKRGASAVDRKGSALNARAKYLNLSAVPVAELAERADPNKPLTDKAKLFVKFWAQGESIPNASARAGYGDGASYAYRIVHLPQVIALYEKEKKLYEEASQMTRKRVMDGLLEGIEMAKLMAEPASMISGWREIGRMCGYYEPIKKTLDINLTGNLVMERMNKLSDAELLKLITDGISKSPELVEEVLGDGDGDAEG